MALRRRVTFGAIAILPALLVCGIASFVVCPESTREPSFLEQPRPTPIYPLPSAASWAEELPAISRVVKPYFGDNRIPIGLIYHALLVWGPDAPFGEDIASPKWRGVKQDRLFVEVLTDHDQYQRYSRFTVDRLLDESPYGVRVVTAGDPGFGAEWGSTHIGTYIHIMAALDMPATAPLDLASGEATLLDVLRDEAMRFDYSQESEWVSCGLPRYLTTPRWRNRFGEEISLDEIVLRLLEREAGKGACLGTHVPMALAVIYGLNQQAEPRLICCETEQRARARLLEVSELLTRSQQADGSWGTDWHHPRSIPTNLPRVLRTLETAKIAMTGHHLEWMTHCPADLRPPDEVMEAAARYLVRTLPGLADELESDFHVYAPAAHAVRALLNASGLRWAKAEWLAEEASSH